jgi:glycine betaine/proline transport system ATP-binding protein
MDEPFSALDPLIRNRLQDELLELQSQLKRSIVFVSHDLDEAFKLGDQIAIMEGGRIVQQGAPKDIYTNPANEYVADFVAHMNPLGVLCARDLVEPSTTKPAIMVTADMDVREIMEQFGRGEEPVVGVMEGDQFIGQISTDRILAKLVDPRG